MSFGGAFGNGLGGSREGLGNALDGSRKCSANFKVELLPMAVPRDTPTKMDEFDHFDHFDHYLTARSFEDRTLIILNFCHHSIEKESKA